MYKHNNAAVSAPHLAPSTVPLGSAHIPRKLRVHELLEHPVVRPVEVAQRGSQLLEPRLGIRALAVVGLGEGERDLLGRACLALARLAHLK